MSWSREPSTDTMNCSISVAGVRLRAATECLHLIRRKDRTLLAYNCHCCFHLRSRHQRRLTNDDDMTPTHINSFMNEVQRFCLSIYHSLRLVSFGTCTAQRRLLSIVSRYFRFFIFILVARRSFLFGKYKCRRTRMDSLREERERGDGQK